jgi:hypothetical protein
MTNGTPNKAKNGTPESNAETNQKIHLNQSDFLVNQKDESCYKNEYRSLIGSHFTLNQLCFSIPKTSIKPKK